MYKALQGSTFEAKINIGSLIDKGESL